MEQFNFPLLEKDDIEVRIGQCNQYGVSLLLYKNARVDMRMLDAVVGPMYWQRSHEVIGGVLYCTVDIYDADRREWVEKTDCGTESNIEKEKGAASDSFKRACTNWGIGRELYTAPQIFVNADKCQIRERGGKPACYDSFCVEKIAYDERSRMIRGLAIDNITTGKRCFVWSAAEP